jgi:hypothetical protein
VGGVTVDYSTGQAANRQPAGACHVVECVGGQLVGGEADVLAVLAGEDAAVEDEEQLVAFLVIGRPVGNQEPTDGRGDAQLFAGFADGGLGRGLAVVDVAARDVAVVL